MTIRLIAYAVVFAVSAAAGLVLTRSADAATLHANSTVTVTQVHYQYGTPYWRYAPPRRAYPRGYFAPNPHYRSRPLAYRYWRWQQFRDPHHYGFRDRDRDHDRDRDRDGRRHYNDHDRSHDRRDFGRGSH